MLKIKYNYIDSDGNVTEEEMNAADVLMAAMLYTQQEYARAAQFADSCDSPAARMYARRDCARMYALAAEVDKYMKVFNI